MGYARHLIMFNVCVKFHENMSSGFKVMERTRKLLTDTHILGIHRKDENYIPPWHTLYAGSINIKSTDFTLHPSYNSFRRAVLSDDSSC